MMLRQVIVLVAAVALVILNGWVCSVVLTPKATFWLSDSSERYYPAWWARNQEIPRVHDGLESVSITGDRYLYTPNYVDGSDAHETGVVVTASGWPVRTLISTRVFENSTTISLTERPAWYHAGITLSPGSPPHDLGRHVPLIPIWTNFSACVLLVWVSINIGLRAYAVAIRRIRQRAQLCVECRYPSEQQSVCPECGTHKHVQ